MRLIKRAEQSLIESLVEETRLIVSDPKLSVVQQVDLLQSRVTKHADRAVNLRAARKNAADPERARKLDHLIAVREKAVAYLRATAKMLVHHKRYPNSMRQRPRMFEVPTWQRRHEQSVPVQAKTEYPFMEFSS